MENPTTHPPHSAIGLRSAGRVLRPGHDPAVSQEFMRLARAALQNTGFDLERFDDLKRRNDAAMREALAEFRAASDERAPAMRDAVARSTENWLKAHNFGPLDNVYTLSTADQISVTSGIEFLSQQIAPWSNSAQVILDKTTDDIDDLNGWVTFTFSWENQTGVGNLFNVSALLGVTATCIVTAGSYWWPLNPTRPFSEIAAYAGFEITQIEDGQVTVPPVQSSQGPQPLLYLRVEGGWTVGTIKGKDLYGTYVLQYLNLFVPANGRVQIDLFCEVNWLAMEGGGQFIAAGNGGQVTAPAVIISAAPWNIS